MGCAQLFCDKHIEGGEELWEGLIPDKEMGKVTTRLMGISAEKLSIIQSFQCQNALLNTMWWLRDWLFVQLEVVIQLRCLPRHRHRVLSGLQSVEIPVEDIGDGFF